MTNIFTDDLLNQLESRKILLRELGKTEEEILRGEQVIITSIISMAAVNEMRKGKVS